MTVYRSQPQPLHVTAYSLLQKAVSAVKYQPKRFLRMKQRKKHMACALWDLNEVACSRIMKLGNPNF